MKKTGKPGVASVARRSNKLGRRKNERRSRENEEGSDESAKRSGAAREGEGQLASNPPSNGRNIGIPRPSDPAKCYCLESLISANSSSHWLKQYILYKIYPVWSRIQAVNCHIEIDIVERYKRDGRIVFRQQTS